MKTILAILLLSAATLHADTLHLTTGKDITGTVTAYGNMNFDLDIEGGASVRQAAATVKSIEFTPREVSIEARGRGAITGSLTAYEGGSFVLQLADGKTEKIAAMFITSISFGGSSKKFLLISGGGQVDMKKLLAPGKITIVDFFADWCGPCKQIGPQLEKLNKDDADVVLRKVDIVKWGTPVTKQFDIKGIPRIQIYDRSGKLVGTVPGAGMDAVRSYVKAAKEAK